MATKDDLEKRITKDGDGGEGRTSGAGDNTKDGDMAGVMGFSDFGGGPKKAKQFDFMALFDQTRKTAMERSMKTFEEREAEVTSKLEAAAVAGDDSEGGAPAAQSGFKSAFKPATKPATPDSEDDDDIIGPPIPTTILKSSASTPTEDDIGPPIPQDIMDRIKDGKSDSKETEEDADSDEEDLNEDNPTKKIPCSHEIALEAGVKAITALGLDPSGARLVAGGNDFDVRLWDFAGMDRSLQSFRTLRPCESHMIKALEYSTTGDLILVVSGNSQAKLIDRDGFEVMECMKGDQYIVDQMSTKGHTAMLNNGCWNPKLREEFMTCSNDCTVRLWTVNQEKRHKSLIKTKSTGGRKTIPTACAYSNDGIYIAAASQDGSIQLWDHRKNFVNVAMKNMKAHTPGNDTTCLCFSYDGSMLASRSTDETVKLWDIRKFSNPLCVASNMENLFPGTDVLFSPDNQLVVTGTSVRRGYGNGKLVFMDKHTLNTVAEIDAVEGASVVRCLWHPRLNQIVVGGGDGSVKVYYDPEKSHRGAKLCVVKKTIKQKQVHMMVSKNIITPYALPMFRQNKPSSTRRQEEKARQDPVKSHKPEIPMSGPGHGGRLGNKGATLSQYVAQSLVMRKPDDRDKDPRAAILRHAEEAARNPMWVDPAYKHTQPKPVFQNPEDEAEVPSDEIEPVWKKQKI